MQVRLLELFGIVATCCFACAALARADLLFECLFFTFTLLMLVTAVLCGIARCGHNRFFWIGFSVAGSLYLGYTHLPDDSDMSPRHDGPLITTQVLRVAFNLIHDDFFPTVFSPPTNFPVDYVTVDSTTAAEPNDSTEDPSEPTSLSLVFLGGQTITADGTTIAFMRSGHCFLP
jgi:hypothetical protein